jgi:superfamily I DNA and/or RNA helicase
MNVAITRAKKKLIVVGAARYIREIKPWDQIVASIEENGQML